MAAGRGLCGRYKLRLEQGMCLLCWLHKLQRLAKEPPVLKRHSAPWLCATCTRDLHHRLLPRHAIFLYTSAVTYAKRDCTAFLMMHVRNYLWQ